MRMKFKSNIARAMKRPTQALAIACGLAATLASAANGPRTMVSPDNPNKVVELYAGDPQNVITPTCTDMQAIPLNTCGSQGPFAIGAGGACAVDGYKYMNGCCTAGSSVTVQANRSGTADPVLGICTSFCGSSNAGETCYFNCPTGSVSLGSNDDNNGTPCGGGGGFGDPRVAFTCPANGKFTAQIGSYIGGSVVVNCVGCITCAAGGGSCDLTPVTQALSFVESKLDSEVRFTDDTELNISQNSINNNIDALEADVVDLESKLDDVGSVLSDVKGDIGLVESKLDDETHYTDDTEFSGGVTTISDSIVLLESKLDGIDIGPIGDVLTDIKGDIALVESKLDDETRYTDDTEFNIGVTNINANIDNLEGDVVLVESKLDGIGFEVGNIGDVLTDIKGDIGLVESKLDDEARFTDDTEFGTATFSIGLLESKLDDETRFTDDTEQGDQTTTIVTEVNENQTILEDAKSEIMLLESKMDGLQTQISTLTCVIIDLLLTPEEERCSDTAECGFGAFPSGLDNLPTPAACLPPTSAPVQHGGGSDDVVADHRAERSTEAMPAVTPSLDLSGLESLVAEATDAALTVRQQTRTFISSALRTEDVDPLLLLSAEQGGLFEQVAALVRDSLGLYGGMKLDPGQLVAAEEAFAEAERLRAEGSRVAAYNAYRSAYRQMLAIATQIK